MKLTEIIFLNDVIQLHRSRGAKVHMIMVLKTSPFVHVHNALYLYTRNNMRRGGGGWRREGIFIILPTNLYDTMHSKSHDITDTLLSLIRGEMNDIII